jgi:hypothetical protein
MAPSLRFGTFGPLLAHDCKDEGSTRFERLPIIPRMSLFSILVIVSILAVVVCFAALYSVTLS